MVDIDRVLSVAAVSTGLGLSPASCTIVNPPPQQSPPSLSAVNIAGTWSSNLPGYVYEITQNGSQFSWKVQGRAQTATGTIHGTR